MNTPKLKIVFIDVGWGDSILIDATDASGESHFALIDCNDSTNSLSGRNFLKRYFERLGRWPGGYRVFTYVFTTHAHNDHVSGVQGVLRAFGTDFLYSSRCNKGPSHAFSNLIRWARRATRMHNKVANTVGYLNSSSKPLPLAGASISVLWPPDRGTAPYDSTNENNNSLVLQIEIGDVIFVLTGDCEATNFDTATSDHVKLPTKDLQMIQVPHHGARNSIFDGPGRTSSFLDQILLPRSVPIPYFAISCHKRPHGHPHPDVIAELAHRGVACPFRTDEHWNLVFSTDGATVTVEYTHA